PSGSEISTLSLHDALPIYVAHVFRLAMAGPFAETFDARVWHLDLDDIESATHERLASLARQNGDVALAEREMAAVEAARASEKRSEEHTSELQSLAYLVCR